MRILYDIDRLNTVRKNIYTLIGISFSFMDYENKYIDLKVNPKNFCSLLYNIPEYREACAACDRKLIKNMNETGSYCSHICYMGLYDAALPIYKEGIYVGTIMLGQFRVDESPDLPPDDITNETIRNMYNKLPYFTEEQIESMRVIISELLIENAIIIEHSDIIEKITNYINANLSEEICIEQLCSKFHISKNTLYRLFYKNYKTTVNEYINTLRIDTAKNLILTNLPIYMVAERVGIPNVPYFCRVFKKKTGCSPTDYYKKYKLSK